ncbi:glutamine--tRNA ligase/YqeY domain fusion protein [Aquimarina sp. ERC-38]|uniref:glutamine--tRNA ligase/YqeY domain fusion protein n=1 Tax=Aquimarina sp. ERC-38 TaxID=2949996 RepID=UPI002246FF98|nr:glutamine--tRNA ligase/YqeY domain fusion protein [Aquimarina sp. ERC-38]UZO81832.1 glutamine--tRNA ligase/YqeY domain fusion protein [Aquimarina sp. ERC-38]
MATEKPLNFIEHIIEEDLKLGMTKEALRFRFPPEPNGYLHIGHTKAIGISFGLGVKYNAPVNLRFDDTNPAKEEQEYVDAIKEDISWLGYQWEKECYSSDYFQQLYDWAVQLIKEGKAYVDSQTAEDIAEQKGTTTEPGVNSPYRDRSVEENIRLLDEMKKGMYEEGAHVLRAKIDMADPNMLMRDPLMYRILKKEHHRTGDQWCIYPMYDWTHGESDYIEHISHSLCSLEFKPHRKLYDWFLDQVYTGNSIRPKQREFARLNLNYTIMSKRKLLRLVEENIVSGWDDPRMPTISGLRRRGYTPDAIKNFVEAVGVAKRENSIDVSLLEFHIREDLNKKAPRVMVVLDPIKLVITNYSDGQEEWLQAENNPEDEVQTYREVPFSKELYIEREDFKEEANRKFFRLTIGKEVRLKNAYIIKGEKVVKNDQDEIIEVHCTYDPESKSGSDTAAAKRQVKGTLHWVSIPHAIPVEVRLYDRLFKHESPDSDPDHDFFHYLNPDSLSVIIGYAEPSLKEVKPLEQFQFQRLGYFNVDPNTTEDHIVFNKTVGLRDTWAKVKPKENTVQKNTNKPKSNPQQPVSKISTLIKAGKKYTNLPEEKQLKLRNQIVNDVKEIEFYELESLYNTSVKKTGTRIATVIALDAKLDMENNTPNEVAQDFLKTAASDNHELLVIEAKRVLEKHKIS